MATTIMPPQSASCFRSDDQRWDAIVRRDKGADDTFFYSVKTTGIYCRPSCASRLAKRENVRFHATAKAAQQAGFRPCKRCRPNATSIFDERRNAISMACKLIVDSNESPDLTTLAEAAGMSRSHFHRVFKALTGLTPKAYATAQRGNRVRGELTKTDSVTGAIYGAGFGSNGRFYSTAKELLGMTPTNFRNGGRGEVIRFAVGECSLGSILVAATECGVCTIAISDDPSKLVRELEDQFPRADLIGGDEEFEQLVANVVGFVERPSAGLALPLDVQGTAFQQRVWQLLTEIPSGKTSTYKEIAKRMGAPKAVRAVARACAANKLAVAIPCHRVVRTDGSLTGYRWGVERKALLLERERRDSR